MKTNFTSFIGEKYFNDISKHQFTRAVNNIMLPINYKNKLTVSTKEIVQLEGYNNYTLFYFKDGNTLLATKTLKEYYSGMDEYFVRIHKKFVINLRYLSHFDLKLGMYVLLKDGTKHAISRRRRKEFIEKTENIFGELEIY